MFVVTKQQWSAARRMRSNGSTLKQISNEIGVPVSTLSNRFKKSRDSSPHGNTIRVINAVSFEPRETVISFPPYDFEKYRTSDELYSTGEDLYEMRQGIIHHTKLPKTTLYVPRSEVTKDESGKKKRKFSIIQYDTRRLFRGSDYPMIAEVIEENLGWNDLIPNMNQFRDLFKRHLSSIWSTELRKDEGFDKFLRSTEDPSQNNKYPYQSVLQETFDEILLESLNEIFPDMPYPQFGPSGDKMQDPAGFLLYMHNNSLTPKKILDAYQKKMKQAEKVFKKGRKKTQHSEFVRIFMEKIGVTEDIGLAIQKLCEDPVLLRELERCGAPDLPSMHLIKDLGFKNWSTFEECRSLGKKIFGACKNQFPTRNVPHGHYSRVIGGEPEFVKQTSFMMRYEIQQGYQEDDAGREIKTSSSGLVTVWRRRSDRFKYIDDSTPNQGSYVSESMLPTLRDIEVEHISMGVKLGVEDWKKFSKKVRTHQLFGDDINEEILQTKGPILDITVFRDLSDPKKRKTRINSKVIGAVKRRDLEDVLTHSWTRFEHHSKALWEKELEKPLPKNGSFSVKITNEMGKLIGFNDKTMEDLTIARQIRNDLTHADEPREKIRPKHIRAVLDATEKIVSRLSK